MIDKFFYWKKRGSHSAVAEFNFAQFEPYRGHFFAFYVSRDLGVQVLGKNKYFTSFCLAYETSIFEIKHKKLSRLNFFGLMEVGGT